MHLKDTLIQFITTRASRFFTMPLVLACTSLLSCSPDTEALMQEGRHALESSDYERAISLFSRAADKDSMAAEAYNGRAVGYFEQQKYGLAIGDLTKSIAIDSTSYKPYYNRGNARQEIKNYEEAVQDYTKAISLKPNVKDIYVNRGVLFYRLANYDLALHDFEFAVKLDSSDVLAQFNMAKTALLLEKEEEARKALTKVLTMQPDYAEAYYWLGMIASQQQHSEEACLLFRKALDTGFEQAKAALEENC